MKRKPKMLKHEIARDLGITSIERDAYRQLSAETIEILKLLEAQMCDPQLSQKANEFHSRWLRLGEIRIVPDGRLCGRDCPFLVHEGGEKYTCNHFIVFIRIARDRGDGRVLRTRACLEANNPVNKQGDT